MGISMVFLGYYWDISAIVSREFLSELRIYGPFSGLFFNSSLSGVYVDVWQLAVLTRQVVL